MQDEEDYVCFTCGGLFPFSFDHQVFRSNVYPSGIVICKPCMRGIAMNKKQRRANKKKAAIRQRRKTEIGGSNSSISRRRRQVSTSWLSL